MDKQKEIEEMAHNLCLKELYCEDCERDGVCLAYSTATIIYNAGYRKIPEGAVVLTREEYGAISLERATDMLASIQAQARKETAKEILSLLYTAIPKTQIVVEIKKRYGVEVEE